MINLEKLTAKQLAAQCIMPRLSVNLYFEDERYKSLIDKLTADGIGGFCLFKGTIEQTQRLTSELQSKAEIPLIFAADFEFGLPMRLSGGTAFPHAMALGKTGDINKTFAIAQLIAREAKAVGVRWNLAPVCDVNSNRDNPIINIRAFGENVEVTGLHSASYIKGTQEEGVIACAKHFPGHGDTATDSHIALPVLNHSINKLNEVEFKPFERAIRNGVRSIMAGHLVVAALDDSLTPASLSAKMIDGILRKQMGFDGLILTDALDMKAIADNYTSGLASCMAINAGNNIALMPENPFEALKDMTDLAEKDKGFLDKLANSAKKIIAEKKWCGMIPYRENFDAEKFKGYIEHEKIALAVASSALDLDIKKNILPISQSDQFAGFAFLQKDEDFQSASMFFTLLGQAVENDCDYGFINEDIGQNDLEQLKIGIGDARLIIFAFFNKGRAHAGNIDIPKRYSEIVKELSGGRDVVAIFFGNPYIADKIEFDYSIKTFSDSLASIAASVLVLSGRSLEPGLLESGLNVN